MRCVTLGLLLLPIGACGQQRTTPAPAVSNATPASAKPTLDPLLLAGRVGLELIDAKGQQVRSRADIYEGDVFTVRGRPAPDCRPHGEPGQVLRLEPGGQLELSITNHRDRPFVPHIIEYSADGLHIADLDAPVAPGAETTTCVRLDSSATDVLFRVVGTTGFARLQDTVMYEASHDISAQDRENTQAKALATLLDNENQQRLTLARLLASQKQTLPDEMVLGQTRDTAEEDLEREVLSLPDRAALLVYAEVDGAMTVAVYETGRDAFAEPLDVTVDELDGLVDGLVAALAGPAAAQRAPRPRGLELPEPETSEHPAPSQVADALLPARVQARLGEIERLVVVPARSLGRAPWFALEIDGTPLVATHSVTIAPDLVALSAPPPPWSRDLSSPLVVGDPTLSPTDFPEWELPPLPGAATEARAVADALGADLLLGESATLEAVRSRVEAADLIYLAAHGVADRKAPLWSSFIALREGPWSAIDVLTADLDHTSLAVLSACQTGLGQDVDAGTIGLARSFYKAGVPRVVMSLWNVDDAGTKSLMLRFVAHLEQVPPAEALRRAADELRQQGADPSVWASFSTLGHPE